MCNEDQKKKWIPLCKDGRILGSYAQTEIGHGSDVSSLETTAIYDIKTDEFIVNTPTPKATKWWPGDLGTHCTHSIVFARMIVEDNDYGVLPFIVQLRDTDSFMPLKGIDLGDMGPKFGYPSKNNGWLSFDNVRIPRG